MLGMCNAYEQHVRWVEYTQMMQDLELGIPTQQTELDLPQSDMVRINDMAPVMRAAGNGVELAQMNFSFAFRISTPGSSPASHRIWKPLQTPSTRPPSAAYLRTASMTGARAAIAPQRR